MDTKKAVSTELPEKSDPESSKSFRTFSEFRFQKEHPFKKLFRVRTFLCTRSMQFSQASRDFLPAIWKIPAQKPQLIVETRFLFRICIIPQRLAAKIYKVVLTILWTFFAKNPRRILKMDFFQQIYLASKCCRQHLENSVTEPLVNFTKKLTFF